MSGPATVISLAAYQVAKEGEDALLPLPGLHPTYRDPAGLPNPEGLRLLRYAAPSLAAQYKALEPMYRLETPAWDPSLGKDPGIIWTALLLKTGAERLRRGQRHAKAGFAPLVVLSYEIGMAGLWERLDALYSAASASQQQLCLGPLQSRLAFAVEHIQEGRRVGFQNTTHSWDKSLRELRRQAKRQAEDAAIRACGGLLAEVRLQAAVCDCDEIEKTEKILASVGIGRAELRRHVGAAVKYVLTASQGVRDE